MVVAYADVHGFAAQSPPQSGGACNVPSLQLVKLFVCNKRFQKRGSELFCTSILATCW